MKEQRFLIVLEKDGLELYLDGYDGDDRWVWTTDRKTAWRLRPEEAAKRLISLQLTFKDSKAIQA